MAVKPTNGLVRVLDISARNDTTGARSPQATKAPLAGDVQHPQRAASAMIASSVASTSLATPCRPRPSYPCGASREIHPLRGSAPRRSRERLGSRLDTIGCGTKVASDQAHAILRPVKSRSPLARWRLTSVACALGFMAVGNPLADVVLFGVHDHFATTQASSHGQLTVTEVSDVQEPHHCHLWMSPAGVAPLLDVPTPLAAAPLPPGSADPFVVAEPFSLLQPPRA